MTTSRARHSATPAPPAASRTPSLRVRDLSIRYRGADGEDVIVLDHLGFEVRPTQFVCLVGRSGSGKTSALRTIVGLTPPRPGTVFWDAHDLAQTDDDARADLRRTTAAYLDQRSGLVNELTLLENALLPHLPDGRGAVRAHRDKAEQLLADLGLGARLTWRPDQTSGGERQRVTLVRALLSGAPTIVADEPTASLDRRWADTVINQLRDHADHGGSVLVASHDPALAAAADITIDLADTTSP